MDSTEEALDTLITDHHHINEAKVASSVVARLRARALANLQKAARRLWRLKDWTFTYVDDPSSVVIPADGFEALLPAPFAGDGIDGGFFTINDPKHPLVFRRAGIINEWLKTSPEKGNPKFYTVDVGSRAESGGGMAYMLKVFPPPSVNTPIHCRYKQACPTLIDQLAPGDGLSAFPVDWRDTVLYEWLVWYELRDKGDVQQMPLQMDIVRDAIFSMCCEERQGKPWEEDLPRFAGSADIFEEFL